MSRVLVTGATTPLGRRVASALLAEHADNRVLAAGLEPAHYRDEPTPRLSYHAADLTHPREIRALLFGPAEHLGVETVVHLAFHRGAGQHGDRAHRLNVEAIREILSLLTEHPTISRLVYVSSSEVYRVTPGQTVLMSEDHPLDLSPGSPQRVRDRVEADLTVCTQMGMAPFGICVLRLAEILAPDSGSQLYDYLQSRVAFRPLGFDPMMNLLTLDDAVRAIVLATTASGSGVFNIPGADTLPLSVAIRKWGRLGLAIPGPLLAPLYQARTGSIGMEFRYDMNYRRFHFSAVLDGSRAKRLLHYEPSSPLRWRALR